MTRELHDHGTADEAIEWALDVNTDGEIEAGSFLRSWREGSLSEWPEYYAWLDEERAQAKADRAADRKRLRTFRIGR